MHKKKRDFVLKKYNTELINVKLELLIRPKKEKDFIPEEEEDSNNAT